MSHDPSEIILMCICCPRNILIILSVEKHWKHPVQCLKTASYFCGNGILWIEYWKEKHFFFNIDKKKKYFYLGYLECLHSSGHHSTNVSIIFWTTGIRGCILTVFSIHLCSGTETCVSWWDVEIFSMWQNLGKVLNNIWKFHSSLSLSYMRDESFHLVVQESTSWTSSSDDWPVPGGDAGASAGPEERDDPHLSRHDGLGAAPERQLQTGHTAPPSGH